MKFISTIMQDRDTDALVREFIQNNMRATKLATSGGFLRAENTVFIIGIEDDRVNEVLEVIKENSHTREQYIFSMNMDAAGTSMLGKPVQAIVGGATVLVLPVKKFKHF